MGQACSTKEADVHPELENREDEAGKRRLSVITLAGQRGEDLPKLPPTTTKKATRRFADNVQMDIFCMSCAGTYAPESYKENQDDYFIFESFGRSSVPSMFCVMDGHGIAGRQVSNFVRGNLASTLSQDDRLDVDPKDVIRQAFLKMQRDLLNSRVDCTCSGTTCVLAYVNGLNIIVANAGDSRCVLGQRDGDGWKARDLSRDHKPELPGEKARIQSCGGRVEPMLDARRDPIGPPRVWMGREMYPGLAMSRSIGDSIAQSVGVSCEPEFIEHTIDPVRDVCLLLASDGVWEFIESDEAINIAMAGATAEDSAELVVRESLKRWSEQEEVCDDITCIVVRLSTV